MATQGGTVCVLTLFLPAVVMWCSYMGWFRPWPVGIGLTECNVSVSVKKHFSEKTMSLPTKTPNSFWHQTILLQNVQLKKVMHLQKIVDPFVTWSEGVIGILPPNSSCLWTFLSFFDHKFKISSKEKCRKFP